MVDLPLMAKLVAALPIKGRLILLGDKDQLSSVEPGAIFGDICSALGLIRLNRSLGEFAVKKNHLVSRLREHANHKRKN